ncbi:hypothetical protein K492DRAFT_179806 [Lichtheimia hyalospora FSU 10163]|nr:hypothetical protein K492DRAFT_179806 [Lichtheimia hyalospora FSU 10163]
MSEDFRQSVRQALQEHNLEELLDIFMDEFRQAHIYLSMDNGEVPRAGLRLAGWQEMEEGHQDLIMSNNRLRLWLGDHYDRTYSQPTLSDSEFEVRSEEEDRSILFEAPSPGVARIEAIVGHPLPLQPSPITSVEDVRRLLAHTPTPTTTPSPPHASPPSLRMRIDRMVY